MKKGSRTSFAKSSLTKPWIAKMLEGSITLTCPSKLSDTASVASRKTLCQPAIFAIARATPAAGWAILCAALGSQFPVPRAPVPVHGSGCKGWQPDGDEIDTEDES